MPLDANSVNQRDHAALVKRTVSGDRVEAAVMLPASEPNVLRWRKDRKANAWSSEARAGVPPAAGSIVQGKQGKPRTNGSLASRKIDSSSCGGPTGMYTAVATAAIRA